MKRATVYIEDDLHKALKLRSVESDVSVSELINDAVKDSLAEDLDDLQAFRDREQESSRSFEGFLREMRADGRL